MFLALFWLQITLALLAAALLWLGVRGRAVDDHPHCRRCGYDLFGLAAGGAGGVCPECGANLRQRGAVRVGVRRRRRGLIALAIFCGVLSFSLGPARNLVWRELVGRPAAFAYAVRAGDAGAVEEHLTARPRLVKLRPAGQSLLDLAVSGSHGEEVVKRLLAAGADPNEVGSGNGFRPLHRAAWEDKPGVAHILLAGGADANVKDGNGERPLHFAARGPGPGTMPQILLAKGADPNARDAHDRSPLHSAASGRDVEVVQVLLDGKADVNAANDEGRTPLHLAAARRNWDVAVALLKAGASLSAQDRGGKVPVALAREGDVEAGVRFAAQLYERALQDRRAGDRLQEVRKALKADPSALREGGREGTLLHVAAALRQSDLVKVLLDAGADVTARDATGKTALHRACWGHDPPTVERLLAAGADANGRDDAGRAPLHVAADSPARAATAELLLKHGADAEARDKQGLTPLETAATSLQDSRAEFLEAVLSVGAKTDVYAAAALGREAALAKLLDGDPALVNGGPGAHRASPLHVAAMFGRVGTARVLLDHGADVNSGIDVKDGATRADGTSPPGRTPLFDAVGKKHTDVAELLLERGARLDLANAGGGTPLHVAAAVGEEPVRLLLRHGADVRTADAFGMTPLHWAAAFGELGAVKALVEAGADVATRDKASLTPLDVARHRLPRHPEIAEYLESLAATASPATTASGPSTP